MARERLLFSEEVKRETVKLVGFSEYSLQPDTRSLLKPYTEWHWKPDICSPAMTPARISSAANRFVSVVLDLYLR